MLLVKAGGISTIFETQKGTPLRGPKRVDSGGNYFASPVLGNGKVYLAGENGTVVVLNNNPTYEAPTCNELEESIVATLAIAGGGLFVWT